MRRCWKELVILLIQAGAFYVLPLFAGPTDAMGLVFLLLAATLALSLLMGVLFGTVWFCTVYSTGKTFGAALMLCVVPYLLPEVVKIALATLVIRRVGPHLRLN